MGRIWLMAVARWAVLGGAVSLALLAHLPAAEKPPAASARLLLLTGRYEEAATAYGELAKNGSVAAAIGLARCQTSTGQLDEAEKTLREAADSNSKTPDLYAELAELMFARGRHESAARFVEQALDLDRRQFTARWIAAELDRVAGKVDEAQQAYAWFVDEYNAHEAFTAEQLHKIGLAAAQYARWKRNSDQFQHLVHTLYPATRTIEKPYWPAHLEAAQLFLEKYNEADAKAELDAALTINPNAAEVHAARARLALQNFDLATAQAAIDRALVINPQLLAARQCRADYWLADQRPTEAIAVLEQARELNPVDEQTLGRLAAAYGAADGLRCIAPDSRLAKLSAEVAARNPHCGEFYMALAEGLDRLRRYPAAAAYYREADRRLPRLLYARGQWGLLDMRLGREAEAAKLLEESFRWDPFNVRVKNMLEVLDVLRTYAEIETEHFVIKFDRSHDEVLARSIARYLEDEVYPQVVGQLGYAPREKSLLEIFSRARNSSGHAWFSARMVGLPFVGTVAACAGQMVAMTSPNDLPQKFNWARVLRHEFVHVVSLQQTDFNIPHWYTEALAVLQEAVPRPTAWSETLARRSRAGTLFSLETINQGFIRPQAPGDWTLAYCQAELYAEFMRAKYGEESLARLLAAYARNLPTATAVQQCFDVDLPEFEAAYRDHVTKVVDGLPWVEAEPVESFAELQRAVEQEPRDALRLVQLAEEYLRRRDFSAARKYALAARAVEPRQPQAACVLARVLLSIGDRDQATQILQQSLDERSLQAGHLVLLAGLRFDAGELDEAERLYRLGLDRCPPPEKWLKLLTRIYLKTADQRKLTDSLRRLADADHDNGLIRKKLLELALAEQDFDGALRWGREALQIDVLDAEVHAQLAQALSWQEQYPSAIEEYETAIRLAPQQAEWRLLLADLHQRAGQKEQAVRVLQELLEQQPEHAKAKQRLKRILDRRTQ